MMIKAFHTTWRALITLGVFTATMMLAVAVAIMGLHLLLVCGYAVYHLVHR